MLVMWKSVFDILPNYTIKSLLKMLAPVRNNKGLAGPEMFFRGLTPTPKSVFDQHNLPNRSF